MILLFVPIALAAPKLNRIWATSLLFWVSPHLKAFGSEWRSTLAPMLNAAIAAAATRQLRGRTPEMDPPPRGLREA
jgi:hypothetical protein